MSLRQYWVLAALLTFGGCREAVAPFHVMDAERVPGGGPNAGVPPVLLQSSSAPPLERYQTTFWLTKGEASTVLVRYEPASEESTGQPFLQLDVPKDGLVAGAGGAALRKGESILVTMTIDTATFTVDFEPSGVLFSSRSPATLTFWYGNAELDLNGNGVVDGSDWTKLQQLCLWYAATATAGYKLSSKNDTSQLIVSAALYHFSTYAVSW